MMTENFNGFFCCCNGGCYSLMNQSALLKTLVWWLADVLSDYLTDVWLFDVFGMTTGDNVIISFGL